MTPYDSQRKPGVDKKIWVGVAWIVGLYVVAGGLFIALRLWG